MSTKCGTGSERWRPARWFAGLKPGSEKDNPGEPGCRPSSGLQPGSPGFAFPEPGFTPAKRWSRAMENSHGPAFAHTKSHQLCPNDSGIRRLLTKNATAPVAFEPCALRMLLSQLCINTANSGPERGNLRSCPPPLRSGYGMLIRPIHTAEVPHRVRPPPELILQDIFLPHAGLERNMGARRNIQPQTFLYRMSR
jgi:hypothetical protein